MLEIADKEMDRWGSFGHVFGIPDRDHPNGTDGQAQAVKFGPDEYGFSLTAGNGSQGVEGTSEIFVAPVQNHYHTVLSVGLEGSNDCGPSSIFHSPCYEFKSTVRFLSSVHAGFFDIEVDGVGTAEDSNGVVGPVNHKSIYVFSGDKYVAQGFSAETGVRNDQSSSGDVASIRKAAEQGDARAQNRLAGSYYDGHGLPQDYAQAVYWGRKAAEKGYAPAQENLGASYASGRGVERDYAQAAVWFRKAAEQGYARAQDNLGDLYENGRGVPQDYPQAAVWYRLAAEQGDATAQSNLSLLYKDGRGVAQDYAQAYFWVTLAAAGKIEGVKQEDIEKWRDDAASHLTPAELSQVRERVRKWIEEHPPKVQ